MTIGKDILRLLSTSRQGMGWYEICEGINYDGLHSSLRCLISAMVNRGMLRTDGKKTCDGCYNSHVVYRITEQGRIHLMAGTHERKRELA